MPPLVHLAHYITPLFKHLAQSITPSLVHQMHNTGPIFVYLTYNITLLIYSYNSHNIIDLLVHLTNNTFTHSWSIYPTASVWHWPWRSLCFAHTLAHSLSFNPTYLAQLLLQDSSQWSLCSQLTRPEADRLSPHRKRAELGMPRACWLVPATYVHRQTLHTHTHTHFINISHDSVSIWCVIIADVS